MFYENKLHGRWLWVMAPTWLAAEPLQLPSCERTGRHFARFGVTICRFTLKFEGDAAHHGRPELDLRDPIT